MTCQKDCRFAPGAPECATCADNPEVAVIKAATKARADEAIPALAEKRPDEIDYKHAKRCLDHNERGDGVLFADLNHEKFLYNVSVIDTSKSVPWYYWDKHVWKIDRHRRTVEAADRVAQTYEHHAKILDNEIRDNEIQKTIIVDGNKQEHPEAYKLEIKKQLTERAKRLRSANGIRKALEFAPVVAPQMAAEEGDFNQKPWLLPCKNGVINLQKGVLQPGKPGDLLTMSIDIDYDEHADYTDWQNFINEICDDAEVAAFLKRSFGYAITGHSNEQYIWVFIGPGRNGKGTLFDLLGDILGPFYHEISRAMLIEQRNEPGPSAASEHKYSLHSKRVIVGAETNKGQKIDASAIKSLTGEDRINCRPNFKSEIVFKPTHTLFLHSNNIPRGLTADFALRQRLLLIEFPWMYVDDPELEATKEPAKADRFKKKNRDLKDILRKNKAGILRWLVEGCQEWQEHGLNPPEKIADSVNTLADEEDYVGTFVKDCLQKLPEYKTKGSRIHEAFRWWWSNNMDSKERAIPGTKSLNTQLREKGYHLEKQNGQVCLFDFIIDGTIEDDVDQWIKKGGKS